VVIEKGFQKLTFTYEASKLWFDTLQVERCRDISIPITEAYNRVLAEDIIAREDLPRFDRSAMDGYAVRAEDTNGASQQKPLLFRFAEGDELADPAHREAKQIWTGNPIPKGANAVIILENTQRKETKLEVLSQAAIGDNIIHRGEDIKKGDIAARAGTRLNPYYIALLSALGFTQVKVIEKPKIAILATGNELAQSGEDREEKQIYESNRAMLAAMCCELDAEPLDLGIVSDNIDEISECIELGLKIADAVITTGGTSIGGLDLVPEAVNKVGKPGVIVHGIAMRPAMLTALAAIERKPVMILSGNPVAAITGFEVFARPLICKLLGMKQEEKRPTVKAVLTRRITTTPGRKNYVRVRVFHKNDDLMAEPIVSRGANAISTMTRANGYVIVPENRESLMEGIAVTVHLLGGIETATSNI
jgi:molybdenum cofactor synthesis domain-containing protein